MIAKLHKRKCFLFSLGLIAALSFGLISCEENPEIGTSNCNVAINISGNGSACIENFEGNTASVPYGNEITVVATPESGNFFIGWYIDGIQVSTMSTYTFTIHNNVSLTARFSESNDRTNITRDIYERELTEDEVSNAISVLNQEYCLQTIRSGIYCLRGGKEGALPSAHAYQRQYSLGPDLYAQYFVVPHKDFMYGMLTSTYDISAEFNGNALGAYTMAKNVFIPVLHHQEINNIPEIKAITLLYYCLSAQEHADLSGPFAYFEDRLNTETLERYDDLRTIYHDIVNSLDNIVACLEYYEVNRPDWYKAMIADILGEYFDVNPKFFLEGDTGFSTYIKLANSLKLRIAMHIVKAEPSTAKEWAEEAVESGVIESEWEQQGLYPMFLGFSHPLTNICSIWGDLVLSASFETLMMSLNHPYTKYVFDKNNYDILNNETGEKLEKYTRICGLRSGTMVGAGQDYRSNQLEAFSKLNTESWGMMMPPLYFIKWAEVDFLRAEGALRGWNMGGDTQFFYERGIRNGYLDCPMFVNYYKYESLIEEYIAQEEPAEYVNVDPTGAGEDWVSPTKIGVAWDESDDNETKLEKIITQKYFALFPLSTEAWTEMRRTGYPKLFPVLNTDDGDGSIQPGEMIRRIPWVPTDPATMDIVNNSAIPALGGPDEQATRLWWDVDSPNF